jgi:hypothetical protein
MGRTGEKAREGMTNKPRGVGDKTAHWPRVRLTTLLVARPFFFTSGQPGHTLTLSIGERERAAITGHGEKGTTRQKKGEKYPNVP